MCSIVSHQIACHVTNFKNASLFFFLHSIFIYFLFFLVIFLWKYVRRRTAWIFLNTSYLHTYLVRFFNKRFRDASRCKNILELNVSVILLFRTCRLRRMIMTRCNSQGTECRYLSLLRQLWSPRIVYLVMIVRLSPSSYKIHMRIHKRRYLSVSEAPISVPFAHKFVSLGFGWTNMVSISLTIVLNGLYNLKAKLLEF
jgi:hypothetical protein